MTYKRPNDISLNIHLNEPTAIPVHDLNWFASVQVTKHAAIFVDNVDAATALVRAANEALAIVTLQAKAKAQEAAAKTEAEATA